MVRGVGRGEASGGRKVTHQPLPPFSAWAGPRRPKILILGEAWGASESEMRQPFVGESGKELWLMLGEAWEAHADPAWREATEKHRYGNAWLRARGAWMEAIGLAYTNVLNLRPPGNKISELCAKKKEVEEQSAELGLGPYDWPAIEAGKYLHPEFLGELERLRAEIEESRPTLIVAAGAKASWALLRTAGIGGIRGAVAQESLTTRATKVLPTYHPAGVLRQWSWRPLVVADLMKAKREAQFPEIRRPQRKILYNPSEEEVTQWVEETLRAKPRLLAADTETKGGQITMISFARKRDEAIVVPFFDPAKPGRSYWATPEQETRIWRQVQRLLSLPLLWQNGLYDLQYICKMGFLPANCVEDTMLLHHSLFPELQKGLGFLGANYTDEASWKLMRTKKADTEKRDE